MTVYMGSRGRPYINVEMGQGVRDILFDLGYE